ncbi:MAG TPA: hypothetical protein VNM92_12565 [Thermoanaerobaculia bacterium]|nr:hypothetical protein [Thermoanaerobaculia bacterium]
MATTRPLVFVYPEKTYKPLGDRRFEVEWQVLTDGARKRFEADPDYEHNHDRDECSVVAHYTTKKAALKAAQRVLDTVETVYGVVTVVEQVVEWYVEEDQIAEWTNVGEVVYVP